MLFHDHQIVCADLSESCVTAFQRTSPLLDGGSPWALAPDHEKPSLKIDTSLIAELSKTSAISRTTIFYSPLASPAWERNPGDKVVMTPGAGKVDSTEETIMSRSDSGFSDGEASQSELQAAGSKQLEGKTEPFEKGEKVSSGSSGHIKPRSRRTSKSRQRVRSSSASSARPLAEERRGSAAPSSKSTSIRHTSSMEKQVRRPSNKTPTPSIRSATSSRRPTLSTRTTPATTTTTSIDIEKAVAVHQKSCQLFQSLGETISHHHGASANTAPHQHHARTPTATRVADGDISGPTIDRSFTARPRPHADVDVDVDVDVSPSSPILWTSHSTRRQEYAKIDRQHRGLRGWLRRWTPACLHRSSRRRGFYQEGAKMSSDTDSVRRYRLDLPDSPTADEEEKEKKEEEEKWGEEVDGDFREKKRKVPCIKFSWKWGRKPSKQK